MKAAQIMTGKGMGLDKALAYAGVSKTTWYRRQCEQANAGGKSPSRRGGMGAVRRQK